MARIAHHIDNVFDVMIYDQQVIGNASGEEESQGFNPDVLGLLQHERVQLLMAVQKVSA